MRNRVTEASAAAAQTSNKERLKTERRGRRIGYCPIVVLHLLPMSKKDHNVQPIMSEHIISLNSKQISKNEGRVAGSG
jgi:hypothetical protein